MAIQKQKSQKKVDYTSQWRAGLSCPECKYRIPMSIPELVSGKGIVCPSCSLKLSVNVSQSQPALTALDSYYKALKRAEVSGR